ncbi:MAG TPA: 6-carboxytetrahydropterin synthase [Bacteroidales bacterium]|nr:6-carboxytetrahydropterin synthase [Bacteroidales bacterium]
MSMVFITRKERFNAAHRLFRPEYSDEQNLKVFGKCSNPNWHGHNYTLLVTVKGEVSKVTGFVANLKELSRIINEKVIFPLDHRNINLEVAFMKGKLASTENLAIAIWQELEGEIAGLGATLHCIRVEETENNMAEYFGK